MLGVPSIALSQAYGGRAAGRAHIDWEVARRRTRRR